MERRYDSDRAEFKSCVALGKLYNFCIKTTGRLYTFPRGFWDNGSIHDRRAVSDQARGLGFASTHLLGLTFSTPLLNAHRSYPKLNGRLLKVASSEVSGVIS